MTTIAFSCFETGVMTSPWMSAHDNTVTLKGDQRFHDTNLGCCWNPFLCCHCFTTRQILKHCGAGSSVSCALLCLSCLFLLNFSLLSITVHVLVSLLRLEFSNNFSINCGVSQFLLDFFVYVMYESFLLSVWGFPVTSGLLCARNVRTISTNQCGAFRFLLDFSVHITYEQFLLTSVGLSGFFQTFLST